MTSERILIVEDEGLVAADIKAYLEDNGWRVPDIVPSGEEALDLMQANHYDLVLMDIVLNGQKDGIETAAIIRDRYQTPIVYLTAYTDNEKITRARMTNPYGYLVKPFDERELRTTVSMSLSKAVNDRAISEGKRWINAVLESIDDGVITTDSSGRIRDVNARAELITGRIREDCIDNLLTDILQFSDKNIQQKFKHTIDRILDSGVNPDYKIEGHIKTKRHIYVEARLSSISYSGSDSDGIVITFNDTTLQHEAALKLKDYNAELERQVQERTRDLKHALDKAEAANRAKSRFLGNISHELRTPLNPISGFSQILMLDNHLNEKQINYARRINESCKYLLEKINDLIDLSQAGSDEFTLNNTAFEPVQLIDTVAQSFSKRFSDKGVELETTYPGDGIGSVVGDYDRLTSILHHLMDNALKFTEQGSVKLGIDIISEHDDSLLLRFSVDDTGPGLPDSIRDGLFEEFARTGNTSTHRRQDTGIGLALCKLLIEAMDGRIGIDSKASGGSVFWFEIRLQKSSPDANRSNQP